MASYVTTTRIGSLAILTAMSAMVACSGQPAEQAPPKEPKGPLEVCGTLDEPPIDLEAELLRGDFNGHHPCQAAFNECLESCRESGCGRNIGGGCAHLCGRSHIGYLALARRFRAGKCRP
jgi:hypothetical protein